MSFPATTGSAASAATGVNPSPISPRTSSSAGPVPGDTDNVRPGPGERDSDAAAEATAGPRDERR